VHGLPTELAGSATSMRFGAAFFEAAGCSAARSTAGWKRPSWAGTGPPQRARPASASAAAACSSGNGGARRRHARRRSRRCRAARRSRAAIRGFPAARQQPARTGNQPRAMHGGIAEGGEQRRWVRGVEVGPRDGPGAARMGEGWGGRGGRTALGFLQRTTDATAGSRQGAHAGAPGTQSHSP
jgi:hypothetical protein